VLAKEAPGIALWALEGLRRLLQNGDFTKPAASEIHIKACKALASPLRAMVDEWCEFGDDLFVSCNTLYDLHKAVFTEDGLRPMNRVWFGVRFKAAFPHIEKLRRISGGVREYVYEGLALVPEAYKRYLGRP
jgi:putative DNA primase/helicase